MIAKVVAAAMAMTLALLLLAAPVQAATLPADGGESPITSSDGHLPAFR